MFKRLLKRFCKWLYQYFPDETYSVSFSDREIGKYVREVTEQNSTHGKAPA